MDKHIFTPADQPGKPHNPPPVKEPETAPAVDPEDPVVPIEDPEIIPDEDPFENPPPYELPEPGEGP